MKCLLIASESAQVLFYWTDLEFEVSLRQRFENLLEQHREMSPAFEDSINTLFAPLLISCITLNEKISDTYTSFVSENNYLFVLHQFGECTYVAVNGDGSENEDDLRRKIFVLKKIIDVCFGLVTLDKSILKKKLRPQDTEQRSKVWKMLQSLLITYSHLREEDQSFLVEAVERLIHPQLCEQCIEFLDRKVVQQINSSMERANEEVVHSFILVHTKLLAFFSSRNASSLRTSDLLLLILIAQDLYPSDSDLEALTVEDLENAPVTEEVNAPELSLGAHGEEDSVESSLCTSQLTNSVIQVSEETQQPSLLSGSSAPKRVFLDASLKDNYCPMMPHNMYCLSLWPGISLVLLTKQMSSSHVAVSLYQLLDAFNVLEAKLSDGQELGHSSRIYPNMPDLRQRMEKFVKAVGVQKRQLQSAWVDFKNKAFSKPDAGSSQELLQACRNVKSQLCLVYQQYFLLKPAGDSQHLTLNLQTKILKIVQEKLMDWKDFLLVKSKRNTTVISYLKDFPGLIHFIYVDRTVGQMIAPSLNVSEKSTELGKGPLASFIKSKVWSLVGMGRRYLQKGYTTLTFRDGDYYCCYFLWFENESGYKLPVIELPVLSDDSAPIGILTGDYYRKLLRYYGKNHSLEVIKCFELLTIHLGVIPTEFIIQQCSDLARRLWEPSRIPIL
ncbi:Hermansky-Pudlak syndrome 1 protein isoform X1 [Chiloscyllium plagiosum]|uniref:Hermansky-Pudlak syndrome 1 protein isoform X1 n=1 Tax=Chiloscyllium plagiosum TaxID=36176 RepID=UPI001CB7B493|nr:Hermansky-Pudlak syndrome 1 protein isoform X1 [Chiloscyllium plagiosum]XP_043568895.1 Hermansky-Pudlak syndrome 1 protein isoform X1 [Chiloscyllium plagiosum]